MTKASQKKTVDNPTIRRYGGASEASSASRTKTTTAITNQRNASRRLRRKK